MRVKLIREHDVPVIVGEFQFPGMVAPRAQLNALRLWVQSPYGFCYYLVLGNNTLIPYESEGRQFRPLAVESMLEEIRRLDVDEDAIVILHKDESLLEPAGQEGSKEQQ